MQSFKVITNLMSLSSWNTSTNIHEISHSIQHLLCFHVISKTLNWKKKKKEKKTSTQKLITMSQCYESVTVHEKIRAEYCQGRLDWLFLVKGCCVWCGTKWCTISSWWSHSVSQISLVIPFIDYFGTLFKPPGWFLTTYIQGRYIIQDLVFHSQITDLKFLLCA